MRATLKIPRVPIVAILLLQPLAPLVADQTAPRHGEEPRRYRPAFVLDRLTEGMIPRHFPKANRSIVATR